MGTIHRSDQSTNVINSAAPKHTKINFTKGGPVEGHILIHLFNRFYQLLYTAYYSHHSIAHKTAVAKTLFTRAENICSRIIKKEEEREHIRNVLKANGYPRYIINRNYSIVPKQPATSKKEPKANRYNCR